jgi:hypothetical protein
MKRQRPDQEQVIAAEAAAVASLTPWVKDGRFEMRNEALARWLFGPELSLWKAVIRFKLSEPDGGQYLIEKAIAGDVVIDTVIRKVIAEKLQADETLPSNLRGYLVNHIVLADQIRQRVGRPVAHVFMRDTAIYVAVETVIDRGFHPTRNDTSISRGDASACSIVSAALAELDVTLSEKSVAAIWQRGREQCGKWSDIRAAVAAAAAKGPA